jgi:hypothetical protein
MSIEVKKISFFRATSFPAYVAAFLLLFTVPVFAFQHSSCYLNNCAKLIGSSVLTKTTNTGDLPCHSSKKKQNQNNCNSGDCDLQFSRLEAKKDISTIELNKVISILYFSDKNFYIAITHKEKQLYLLATDDTGRYSLPLYITNKTLLI